MTKKIEFASKYEYLTLPQPAKKYIPEWYRKAERFVGGKPIIQPETELGTQTIKLCVPFLDSLTSGYVVELWQDVTIADGEARWAIEPEVLSVRKPSINQGMPAPKGYLDVPFAWQFPFYFKTPPGYSVLMTHPFNRFDLPFITLSGIVDADQGIMAGNAPFFMQEGFSGLIPKGTPIALLFPFKRDDWKSEHNPSLIDISKYDKPRSVISGWYKKNRWYRKEFN
jgi:hypothetical protein